MFNRDDVEPDVVKANRLTKLVKQIDNEVILDNFNKEDDTLLEYCSDEVELENNNYDSDIEL